MDEIARDPDVAVVDIAVFPWVQDGIAMPLLDAGKHLLCQKPLSYDYDEAVRIVEHAREAQAAARREPAVALVGERRRRAGHGEAGLDRRALRDELGLPCVHALGELGRGSRTSRASISTSSRSTSSMRCAGSGEPLYAYGTQAREPGQPEQGETRTISVLEFAGETRALLRSFHKNRTGDPRAEFRIDGTQGSIRGTIGLMYDYPRGRADTLELNSRVLPTDGWLHYPVTTRWIPTAFIGPMAVAARGGGHGRRAADERPGQPRHAADRPRALPLGRRSRRLSS